MSHASSLAGHTLIKGHGSGNDFLMLVDPQCEVALSTADVAHVCARHTGLGADGFVRIVHTRALPGGEHFAQIVPEAQWFMDYYNADGSVAEMCGNAIRVMAQVLVEEGLVEVADGDSLTIGTRGGARTLTRLGNLWAVDMGRPSLPRREHEQDGWDTIVHLPGVDGLHGGLSVAMPNPHTVVALPDEASLEAVAFAGMTDSGSPVSYQPTPERGTNLEVVVPTGETVDEHSGQRVGHARVRILERGVGETLACGTGVCAVAVALYLWGSDGGDAVSDFLLTVPGGELGVHVGGLEESVILTGPAQLVARVEAL